MRNVLLVGACAMAVVGAAAQSPEPAPLLVESRIKPVQPWHAPRWWPLKMPPAFQDP